MNGMEKPGNACTSPGNFDFSLLRRFPDVEAQNLFAHDATDQLILVEANDAIAALAHSTDPASLAVVGDRYGALSLGAAKIHGITGIKVHQDAYSGELALAANSARLGMDKAYESLPLGGEVFAGAKVVLWQLPRGLDEVAEVAALIASHASPSVKVFAGGRVKHMTLAMNEVLAAHFDSVVPGRAWRKSRLLVTSGLLHPPATPETTSAPTFPRMEFNADLGLWLCAHGAVFGGTKLDLGTRFLLGFEPQMSQSASTAIDLGCGNGSIGAFLATARPGLQLIATDQSAAAIASTIATAEANGVADRIATLRDDALAGFASASADLVVLNPPFHVGAAVHAGIALKLFDAAGRVLVPQGELWTVYNRHLDYRAQLERRVGPTEIVGQNSKFTVSVSRKTRG